MNDITRRRALQAALASTATPLVAATATSASACGHQPPDVAQWVLATPQGTVELSSLSHRALRVRFLPPQTATPASPASLMLLPGLAQPLMKLRHVAGTTEL